MKIVEYAAVGTGNTESIARFIHRSFTKIIYFIYKLYTLSLIHI